MAYGYGDHPEFNDRNDLTERNDLTDRKKMILKAVIDAHIRGGEPVGSKYLTQSAGIKLSSVTFNVSSVMVGPPFVSMCKDTHHFRDLEKMM